MPVLGELFREKVKQTKDISQINEMSYSISYPTGYLNLDFANGYIQEIDGEKKFELGLSDGSINMLISDSGVGKTTLACQIANNIVAPFGKNGLILYEQAEVGTNIQRMKNLSGLFSNKDFVDRFIPRDAGITTESVYKRVKMMHDLKVENAQEFTYDTGLKDLRGKSVIKFIPTVMIVDSVKMVLTDGTLSKDNSDNMEGAVNAKANSNYYTRMVPLCREANIIMILINHITMNIKTGPFHEKPELPYLKEGEHIAGGKSLTYIQNNIFRLDIRTKLKPTEGFGITGSVVNIDIVKSRTNKTSRARCCLVFDQDSGYDSDYSLFFLLKENNILEASGAYYRVPGCERKFMMKNFKSLLYSDTEFYNAFANCCYDILTNTLLREYAIIKEQQEQKQQVVSPYMAILSRLQL
jgi:RecA/RadA recombinase